MFFSAARIIQNLLLFKITVLVVTSRIFNSRRNCTKKFIKVLNNHKNMNQHTRLNLELCNFFEVKSKKVKLKWSDAKRKNTRQHIHCRWTRWKVVYTNSSSMYFSLTLWLMKNGRQANKKKHNNAGDERSHVYTFQIPKLYWELLSWARKRVEKRRRKMAIEKKKRAMTSWNELEVWRREKYFLTFSRADFFLLFAIVSGERELSHSI